MAVHNRLEIVILLVIVLLIPLNDFAQKLEDDFNRSNNSSLGNNWLEVESGSNVIEINNQQARINTGGISRRDYFYKDVSTHYETTLANNSSKMTWLFNMHQSRDNPSGFGAGNYGTAFVLASSNSDFPNTGEGYALVLGESGSGDELKLGHYSGGINGTNGIDTKIIGGNGPNNGFSNEYFAIKVTFEPATSEWALYYQAEDTGFIVPQNITSWQQIGAAQSNNTYTNQSLPFYGGLFNHNTSTTDSALFDNFNIPYPEVNFKNAVANVKETGSTLDLKVTSTNTSSSLSADVQIAGAKSTADNGNDIQQFNTTTLNFNTTLNQSFSVTPSNDNICETAEYLTFELANLSEARRGANDTLRLYVEDSDHHIGGVLKTDFEGKNLPGFLQNQGDWKLNDNFVINGNGDLAHKDLGKDGESYIYTQISGIDLKNDSTVWQMNLKKDASNPSLNNRFWFYLLANESDLSSSTVDGYAIGVNLDNNNDQLRLWRVKDGKAEKVLAKTVSTVWRTSDPIGIRVTRTAGGKWDLWYDDDGNGAFDNLKHVGFDRDRTYLFTDYCGLYTQYTSSRTGVLQLDDLEIVQNTCRDNYGWNGGGNGSNWLEGQNWDQGLSPLNEGNTVTLDNKQVNQGYQVNIPPTMSVTGKQVSKVNLNDLIIQPASGLNIDVIREQGSDFTLKSGGVAMLLKEGATYEDQSSEGFPSLPNNGDFEIKTGAEFLVNNQASFSTAGLQGALSGNSDPDGLLTIRSKGQALSASGKTYPLSLSLESQTGSATYTTTGGNPFIVKGDFTIGANVTYQSDMDGNLTIEGDLNNQGTMTFNGNQMVILSGGDKQFIDGGLGINDLEINNSQNVELKGAVTVNDSLILTNGHLNLANNDLTINGKILGFGPSNYLKTSGKGLVNKSLGTSRDTFPIGLSLYLPVMIRCNDCTSQVTFGVGSFDGFYNDPENQTGQQTTDVVGHTWEVLPSTSVGDVDLILEWPSNAQLSGFSQANAYMGKWESNSNSLWNNQSVNVNGSDPYEAERKNISINTNTHYFAIGDNDSPLPVELVDFKAIAKKDGVKLKWQTASETNNSHFEIQRAKKEGHWKTLGSVQGNGTTLDPQSYQFFDPSIQKGTHYYRLRQVDFDGSSSFSYVRSVKFKEASTSPVEVFVKNHKVYWRVKTKTQKTFQVRVVSASGKLVYEGKKEIGPGDNKKEVPQWDGLASGVYYLELDGGSDYKIEQFVKPQ